MLDLLLYCIAGLIGGTNMILWGIYGDLLSESFSLHKMYRSLFLSLIYSIYLFWVNNQLPLILVTFSVISLERISTEIYKAFLREEDQLKYKIPSDFNLKLPRLVKMSIGIFLILIIILAVKYLPLNLNIITFFIIITIVPALGGMMKDAPYEGFLPLKFLRSPIVTLLCGWLILTIFPAYEQNILVLSILGAERILCECYKKILNGRCPGKFIIDQDHPINNTWKKQRRALLLPYIINILLILMLSFVHIQ
jgi:hypothetical protein